jgi:hypothetical protein
LGKTSSYIVGCRIRNRIKNYGQEPDFETLLELDVNAPEVDVELDEQLDWAPPEAVDILPWIPLGPEVTIAPTPPLGPEAVTLIDADDLGELLNELELVEQLPELPLTLNDPVVFVVLEEPLQLNAFAKCNGIIPMMNIAAMALIATVTNIGDFCILSLFLSQV